MLTCIACTKQLNTNNGGSKKQEEDEEEEDRVIETPRSKQIKSLTSQVEINILPLCHFHEKKTQMRKGPFFALVGFCLEAKNKSI
jgi:hypothetical protein